MKRSKAKLAIIPVILLLALGTTAGSKSIKKFGRDHVRVDGVELEQRREVELVADLGERLEIESQLGDVELTAVEGSTARLRVEIFEYTEGDLRVELTDDGRIVLHSEGGHPGAVGEVVGEVPRSLDLEIATGCGDVRLEGFAGGERIELATGMGDILVVDLSEYGRVEAASGKGDIRLGPAEGLAFVELATGMGGIKLKDARVEDVEVSTGMGSIRFLDCTLGRVSGGTGMGSVKFKRTTYEDSDVGAGIGGVSMD